MVVNFQDFIKKQRLLCVTTSYLDRVEILACLEFKSHCQLLGQQTALFIYFYFLSRTTERFVSHEAQASDFSFGFWPITSYEKKTECIQAWNAKCNTIFVPTQVWY